MMDSVTANPVPLVGAAFAALVVYAIASTAFNLFLHPLRKYPGPRHWAASRVFLTFSTLRGRYPHDVNAFHRQYGHVVRVAPNQLSFTDERAWRDICGATRAAPLGMMKDERLNDLVGGDATNPDPSKSKADMQHTRMRKSLAPAFTMSSARQQVPLMNRHLDEMLDILNDAAREGRAVNMSETYFFTLYDIFSDLFLGESMNLLRSSALRPWANSMPGFAKATTSLAVLSHFLLPKLLITILLKLVGTKSRDNWTHPCFDRFDRRMQSSKEGSDRRDIVHFVLDGKQQVTVAELRAFTPFLMVGGGETMGSLMPCLTYLLLTHRAALQRLVREVRTAFASTSGKDGVGGEEEVTADAVLRLPYLAACISEALRLYPPVVNGNDRVVPPGGAPICGEHVPGGTIVVVSHLATNRQKRNWFRPDEFLPERWLSEGGVEFAGDCRGAFKPFSVGPQNCFGQDLANLTLRLLVVKLLLEFDMELDPETNNAWHGQLPVYNVWMKPPLMVRFTKSKK